MTLAGHPRPTYMQRAADLAQAAVATGTGGPFGALVVRGEEVLGEGQNRVLETNDPTAHAEVTAIRAACARERSPHLAGAVLYSSCEPCPLCLAAALWARLAAVWYSADRHDAAAAGFDDALFHRELALPAPERTLTVRRFMPEASQRAFVDWRARADRRMY